MDQSVPELSRALSQNLDNPWIAGIVKTPGEQKPPWLTDNPIPAANPLISKPFGNCKKTSKRDTVGRA
jgi:hypothetical protein